MIANKYLITILFVYLFNSLLFLESNDLKELLNFTWKAEFVKVLSENNTETDVVMFNFKENNKVEFIRDFQKQYIKVYSRYELFSDKIKVYSESGMLWYLFYKNNGVWKIDDYSSPQFTLMKFIKEKRKEFDIRLYTVTVDNLRMREWVGLDSQIIGQLKKDENIELLFLSKEEIINGLKCKWAQVRTEQGEIGWCFDAYLEEVED